MKKRDIKKFFLRRNLFIIFIYVLFVLILFLSFYFSIPNGETFTCGDRTLNKECSARQPYFCLNGTLIENASVCGCPLLLTKNKDSCKSKYQVGPKNIILEYILRGEKGEINFTVYEGMIDYILNLPKTISYEGNEKPLRRDFKLKRINEEQQRELLLPLVTEIQNIAKDKKDQARIAISLVQSIPYSETQNKIILGKSDQVNYSRYAYEVLYDNLGACEGRSELLTFLLKEIGYGVVLFYYPLENHEVVGIKCPVEYSLDNTGYCFIETTGPSILSNDQGYYLGLGKLYSTPEMILISEGESLGKDLYEYKDAKDLIKITNMIKTMGEINIFYTLRLNYLRKKYGLEYI